jgi:hypothetical protein
MKSMSGDEGPASNAKDAKDVVLVHSTSETGDSARVVRLRPSSVEFGELRALQEGVPVHGDVVRLHQRTEHERLFDVEVLVPAQSEPAGETKGTVAGQLAAGTGPPQVATEAYRANWEAIFGPNRNGKPN